MSPDRGATSTLQQSPLYHNIMSNNILDVEEAEVHELGTMGERLAVESSNPVMLSAALSAAPADPQEGTYVQELPPVDRGIAAWTFCAAGLLTQTVIWGFTFRSASLQSSTICHR